MVLLDGNGRRPITAALSPDDPAYAGQARYTAGFPGVYDTVVLRLNEPGCDGAPLGSTK